MKPFNLAVNPLGLKFRGHFKGGGPGEPEKRDPIVKESAAEVSQAKNQSRVDSERRRSLFKTVFAPREEGRRKKGLLGGGA